MARIRIGLIGYGRFGRHHAAAIAGSRHAELVGVAAQSEATCRKARRELGVETTSNYKQLLQREDVDAVDIAVPTHLHEQFAVDALRSRKHVFLEKPMASTVQGCDRILAAAADDERVLCINFELRASPLWGRIKKDVDSGKIGAPLYGSYDLWRFPFRRGRGDWRFDQARVGSWLHEEPVHYLDLASWFFADLGVPQRMTAHLIGRDGAPVELSENMTCLLRWPDGQFFQVTQTNSFSGYHQIIKIAGEDGAIVASWEGTFESDDASSYSYALVKKGGREYKGRISARSSERLDLERNVDMFCLRTMGRTSEIATGEDGRRAVALVESALASARAGRTLEIRGL